MKKTVAIIGGTQETTFKQIGRKLGVDVLFHCGKSRNGGNKKEFRTLVKKADCVVILLGALGHVSMDIVKEVCKEQDIKLLTHDGRGASGAIQKCVSFLNTAA
jgi:hypothetical protein